MKKTVLFGAGSIASQVILYDRSLDIVAVADNDKNKVGSLFHDIPVISPAHLQYTDFDEVMITTGRINDARAQLIGMLGVSTDAIVLPRQLLTKSLGAFHLKDNQRLANLLLTKLTVSDIAAELGVIVDLDTLKDLAQLGTIRPQASLLHLSLSDSGLSQFSEYIAQELSLLSETEKFKWQLNPMKSLSGEIIAYVLEIGISGHESSPFSVIFRGYLESNEYAIDLPGHAMFFAPLLLRDQTILQSFGEITCRIPLHWEEYLTFIFDDWQYSEVSPRLYQYRHRGYGSLPESVQQTFKDKAPWLFVACEEVSIVMVIYNNVEYLEEAIESALLQLAPYRFVIHCLDDASDDGSTELLREYQRKFGEFLTLYISKVNQGSGKRSLLMHKPDVKGNFWVFLSGDDFWLTPFNLWYQTNYLIDTPSAVGCCCSTIMRDETTDCETIISPKLSRWNLLDLMLFRKRYRFYTHTSSIFWRNTFYQERGFFLPAKFELPESRGDVMLAHFMLENGGEMHMLDRVMNFYRYTRKGVWSSIPQEEQVGIIEKSYSTLYSMISMKNKLLCRVHKSSIIPIGIKKRIRGPLNGR